MAHSTNEYQANYLPVYRIRKKITKTMTTVTTVEKLQTSTKGKEGLTQKELLAETCDFFMGMVKIGQDLNDVATNLQKRYMETEKNGLSSDVAEQAEYVGKFGDFNQKMIFMLKRILDQTIHNGQVLKELSINPLASAEEKADFQKWYDSMRISFDTSKELLVLVEAGDVKA